MRPDTREDDPGKPQGQPTPAPMNHIPTPSGKEWLTILGVLALTAALIGATVLAFTCGP